MAPREENADPATPSSPRKNSAWSPFRHNTFAVIWTATVISNIGGWMYSAASGWLMTSLNPSPLIVSLVQVATSLPYCLFALPAGALADIVDRRKLLIFGEVVTIVFSSALAALVLLHRVTPLNLLLLTFLIEAGSAVVAPVWQAVVPQLVPKSDLAAAVSANSAGINVSRAVGPALSGAVMAHMELRLPFGSTPLAPWPLLARSYGGANRVAATDVCLQSASSMPFARVCDMRDITDLLVRP